jgi:hypothetical protein
LAFDILEYCELSTFCVGQVFKQASCIPDDRGICPTSLRVSDDVTKLWVRCGNACWTKNIFHKVDEVHE